MNDQNSVQSPAPTQTQTGTQTCPNCGIEKADWRGNNGQGFQVGDKTYCCQGCATGTGCTCQ